MSIMHAAPAFEPTSPPEVPSGAMYIDTRFGTVEISRDNIIKLPGGLLGFETQDEFALINLPDPRLSHFKLLQAVSDPGLSFVVIPLNEASGFIAAADLDDMAASCGIPRDRALFLLIVTVKRGSEGVTMTANLRAPVIVHKDEQTGRQHVLNNGKYSIRHPL